MKTLQREGNRSEEVTEQMAKTKEVEGYVKHLTRPEKKE